LTVLLPSRPKEEATRASLSASEVLSVVPSDCPCPAVCPCRQRRRGHQLLEAFSKPNVGGAESVRGGQLSAEQPLLFIGDRAVFVDGVREGDSKSG
jgi:hypothetical protein